MSTSSVNQIRHEDLIEIIRENIQDLIAVIDSNRRRVWFNEAYSNTLGYTRAELESGDSTASLHPDDIGNIRKTFEEVMTGGRGRSLRYRMHHKSGSWVWLESRSRVIEHVPGIGKCIILVARNITRQMERQFQREAMEQRLSAQKKALVDLAHAPELVRDDRDILTWKVTSAARQTLSCREVSVWWVRGETLVRQGFTRGGKGWETTPRDFLIQTSRLTALDQTPVLAYSDGALDEHAGQWRTSNIVSASLQVGLRRGGALIGVIVCAAENSARTWHPDEQSFAESMGAILMQSLEARERRLAFIALEASQKKLAQELNEASEYVQALLPKPLMDSPRADWIFVPSAELGGDAFGYHWIDDEHFAIYLLDVCGHGVGAALLSISALNVLRSSTIPGVDFRNPELVLSGMNAAFDMEKQNNMYFTLWYGVWNKRTQTLSCSCGGHPPALLYLPGENEAAQKLGRSGMVVGAVPDIPYASHTLPAPVGSTLLLFSDGVYEITKPEGGMWTLDEFGQVAGQKILQPGTNLSVMADEARALYGQSGLEDDFSLVRIVF